MIEIPMIEILCFHKKKYAAGVYILLKHLKKIRVFIYLKKWVDNKILQC